MGQAWDGVPTSSQTIPRVADIRPEKLGMSGDQLESDLG
jgi:hypothetical protein